VVVNLDRRPDRMEACGQSCAAHCPWLPYRRIPAVDGRKEFIDTGLVATSWHSGLNVVYQKIRSQRKGWDDLDNYVPRELKLSPGERGCSMSHIRAWRHCAELNRPLMVLEDDAALTPDFTPTLTKALAALPEDAQVLYLGYSQAANWRRELSPHLVESEYVWTTVGYIIWPSGAKYFLEKLPVDQPVDNWMASQSARGPLRAYAVRPKIVRQAEEWNVASDVMHSDEFLGSIVSATSQAAGARANLSHNTHHSVDLWSDSGTNQQWTIKKVAGEVYTIQTVVPTSGRRIYLSHDTHQSIDLWCDAGKNQQWRIKKVAENLFTIQAASSTSGGKSFLGRNARDGVELFEEAGPNQHWSISNFELDGL
jgi:glycosyl transferase family 25